VSWIVPTSPARSRRRVRGEYSRDFARRKRSWVDWHSHWGVGYLAPIVSLPVTVPGASIPGFRDCSPRAESRERACLVPGYASEFASFGARQINSNACRAERVCHDYHRKPDYSAHAIRAHGLDIWSIRTSPFGSSESPAGLPVSRIRVGRTRTARNSARAIRAHGIFRPTRTGISRVSTRDSRADSNV